MNKMNIIVYGTLKEKGRATLNNWHKDAKKIKDVIVPGFVMYDNGSFPMCIPGDGNIHGELWHVPETILNSLDMYEGHPDLFARTRVLTTEEEVAEMYVYQGSENKMHPNGKVSSGFWECDRNCDRFF